MLFWVALHFAIGALGTLLARRYAMERQLLDHPGERRSHHVATPRGGGMAIVAALMVAVVALAARDPSQRWLLAGFGSGLMLVAVIGLLDDHRPLSARLRLAVHALAGSVFAFSVFMASGNVWLGLLALALAMILTNVWNFMDGINGLAASQALLVALGMTWLLGGSWGLVAIALMAASAGFLPFNFPTARVFLGDVGSGAIGFAIAGLTTVAVMTRGTQAIWLLLPLSAFLLDASLTLIMRLVQGEQWWTAHTRHAFQVWARSVGHTRVTVAYAGWTAVAVALMVMLGFRGAGVALWMAFVTCLAGTVVWWKLIEWKR